MSDKLQVQVDSALLPFLFSQLSQWSRSKIKQRLQSGCVSVNQTIVTQHDFALHPGDSITVSATSSSSTNTKSHTSVPLEILYSDRDLIAINKPAGLLSVGTTKETQNHALAILRKQLSRRSQPVQLWPVHRIDRDTSGVLLFATSRAIRETVMSTWETADKKYLAIVKGNPNPPAGTINEPLRLDEHEYRMHVGAHPDAKPAVTHYRTEEYTAQRSLLNVTLETGRQHQIRAHLSWLGYPIIGDMRYGIAGPRMGLHALSLSISKPGSREILHFETPAPADFLNLMRLI